MEGQVNINRKEMKYYIHKREACELRQFLRINMNLDSNGDETGDYWIRSLYFDTFDNKDYYEKVTGTNIRKKIRLRIYDISASYVKLEIKNKYGSGILKETAAIKREDAQKLIHGDCNPLLDYGENTAKKVFAFMHQSFYRPKVIIDYEREAYIYPFQNIRVTLDKNLRANTGSWDLFGEHISMIPVINSEVLVLEIKFDEIIPVFLQRALSSFTAQKSQISKYCLGRSMLGR